MGRQTEEWQPTDFLPAAKSWCLHTHTHTKHERKKKRIGSSGSKRVTSVGSGSWRLLSDWIGRSLGLDICVQGIYSILCEIENLERMLFIFLKTWKTPRVELDVFILTESSGGVKGKNQGCFCVVLVFLRLWTKASGSPDVTSQMKVWLEWKKFSCTILSQGKRWGLVMRPHPFKKDYNSKLCKEITFLLKQNCANRTKLHNTGSIQFIKP